MRKHSAALFIILLSISACSSTPMVSVMPMEDGSFKTVATADTEPAALNSSLHIAESTCRERNLRHMIMNVNTRFRGMPARSADPMEQPAELARYVNSPTFPSLSANDDYEVKLQFRCS